MNAKRPLQRTDLLLALRTTFKHSKIIALIGPRQVGKSTLAHEFSKERKNVHFFDLEDPTDEKLLENPQLTLDSLEGFIVIDEIQRSPGLFPYLRVKADRMKNPSRILILGSSSRDLLEKSAESLAGRISYIEVPSLKLEEVKNEKKLFLRGGFPQSFLAKTHEQSFLWRKNYVQSFTERDLKTLGFDLPAQSVRRFMEMLTGYHGQIFNASEIGKSLGLSHTTIRKYFDILTNTFLVRELKPWYASILQRQVKLPKIYIRDSGLLLYLLGISTEAELSRSPRIGSFWEGFALEQTVQKYKMDPNDLYFWSIHQGGEIDLFWKTSRKKIGFEFKYSDAPEVTNSMRKSIEVLKLDELIVVYPGKKSSRLDKKIILEPLS